MRTILPLALALVAALACGGAPEEGPAAALPTPTDVSAPATPPTPAPPAMSPGWAVITSGSPDRAAAEAQMESYRAHGLPIVGAWPQVVESGTVEGLKPGFFVVVVAIVDDEAVARHVAEAWQGVRPGTYVREVRVPAVESLTCEGAAADPRCHPGPAPEWRALVVMDFIGLKNDEWTEASDEVCRTVREHGVACVRSADLQVPIEIDGSKKALVDVAPFSGELYGYAFAMDRRPPVYHAHDMPHVVLYDAGVYWGLPLGE